MRNSIKTEQEFRDFIKNKGKFNTNDLYSLDFKLNEGFVEEFIDELSTHCGFVEYCDLSEGFIEKHIDKIKISNIFDCYPCSEDFLERISYKFDNSDWVVLSRFMDLSENFIDKYADKLDWGGGIFFRQKLSIPFIEKHIDKLKNNPRYNEQDLWNTVFRNQKLSVPFIKKYLNWLEPYQLSNNPYLTLEIAREFKDIIEWVHIDYYGAFFLTEEFVNEFADKLNIKDCFSNNAYSEAFCEKWYKRKKVPLNWILGQQAVSVDFILRYADKINSKGKKLILGNVGIKKDMEFWEKLGHLFEFSEIPFSRDVLVEFIRCQSIDLNELLDKGSDNLLRELGELVVGK